MGDGCNMEGVSNEACSLAGHWGLGKLIAFYDDNHISIDGHTDISFTEDVCARYEALGWHTIHVENGNTDYDAIRKAVEDANAVTDKPTLIKVTTLIGYGSPNKADSHDVHGAALGPDEVAATRANLKWDYAPFEVPDDVYGAMRDSARSKGASAEAAWQAGLEEYAAKYPEEAAEFKQLTSGELPAGWESALPSFTPEDKGAATRIHSQTMLNALAPALPGFMGGSADLAPSNMTLMKMFGDFQKDTPEERNVRFGVREHGMGAICNGMILHGSGIIPYCATFFIFSDYMRAAIRLSALSEVGVLYVMTHDSIGLGEDGPTHQPGSSAANAKKGGYVIYGEAAGAPDCILIGTDSEVEICIEAAKALEGEGKKVRVVSMPCTELFDAQSAEYKESILPAACSVRVSCEAGSTFGWGKYVGNPGASVGVDDFGASAPANILYEKYGITADAVVQAAKGQM